MSPLIASRSPKAKQAHRQVPSSYTRTGNQQLGGGWVVLVAHTHWWLVGESLGHEEADVSLDVGIRHSLGVVGSGDHEQDEGQEKGEEKGPPVQFGLMHAIRRPVVRTSLLEQSEIGTMAPVQWMTRAIRTKAPVTSSLPSSWSPPPASSSSTDLVSWVWGGTSVRDSQHVEAMP